MALISAKCPNCGAVMSVDGNGKADICQYCNSAFVVQEAIQNFNNTYMPLDKAASTIQPGNVTLEQVDPEYLKKLQEIKAKVNRIKESENVKFPPASSEGYKMRISEMKSYANLYFDKPEIWYYYALYLYYSQIWGTGDDSYPDWVPPFEQAIKYTTDTNKKSALTSECAKLKAELPVKRQQIILSREQKKQKEEETHKRFFNDLASIIKNNPQSLDCFYVYGSEVKDDHTDFSYKYMLMNYQGKLMIIGPHDYGKRELMDHLNKAEKLMFVKPMEYVYARPKIREVITSEIIPEAQGDRKFSRDYGIGGEFRSTYLGQRIRYHAEYDFDNKTKTKENYIQAMRFSEGLCPKCGGKLIRGLIFDTIKCSNCSLDLSRIRSRSDTFSANDLK